MALFGKGGRTHKRVISAVVTVGTLGAFQALAMVGATPAISCNRGELPLQPCDPDGDDPAELARL